MVSRAAKLERAWGWSVAVSGTRSRVVELGVEDRDAEAVFGEHVAVGEREPADEPGQAQPPQVAGLTGCASDAGIFLFIRIYTVEVALLYFQW